MANIVLISDHKTIRYIPSNLFQISVFVPEIDSVFLITNCPPEEKLLHRLVNISNDLRIDLKIVHVDELSLVPRSESFSKRVPQIALLKLFLGEILVDVDIILYLDIDTLIREPLPNLLKLNFETSVSAVEEISRNWIDYSKKMSTNQYFNTGVLLISLRKFCELEIANKVRKLISEQEFSNNLTFRYIDQDIFNYVFSEDVTLLPRRFNHFASNDRRLGFTDFFQEAAIVHFVGIEKPWDMPKRSKYTKEWITNFNLGLGSHVDSIDSGIIRSAYGTFGIDKILQPIFRRLWVLRKRISRNLPDWFKRYLRRI